MSELNELNKNKQQSTFTKIREEFEQKPEITKSLPMAEEIKEIKVDQDHQEILNEQRNKTMREMPETLKEHKENIQGHGHVIDINAIDEEAQQEGPVGMDRFPVSLTNAINALVGWEKVKAVSSAPVKEAAEKLMGAEDDATASKRLGELLDVSIKYLDLRNDQWHLWFGEGRRRLKQVKTFIDEAYAFSATAPAVYDETIKTCMDTFYSQSMEKPEKYHRFVENAELLRDINAQGQIMDEKPLHIKVENKLTQKKFNKLLELFTGTDNLGYDDLHFESPEAAALNKKTNIKILQTLKNKSNDLVRGFAMDLKVKLEAERFINVRANMMTIDYMLEHIDEQMDPQAILTQKKNEAVDVINDELEELDKFYGIANGYKVAEDKEDFKKLIKEPGNTWIKEFKDDPNNKELLDQFKAESEANPSVSVDDRIIEKLRNEYRLSGNPRAWYTDFHISGQERDARYIRMLKRKAKGRLTKEAAGTGARTMASLKLKMDEMVDKNDLAAAGRMVKDLLNTDLDGLRRNMMSQINMYTSRLYEILALRDYMPYITANAKAIGLSPDDLARLDGYCDVAGKIDETHKENRVLFANGNVYLDDEEFNDSRFLDTIKKYAVHIDSYKNQDYSQMVETISLNYETYNEVVKGYKKTNTDELLKAAVIKKEDSVMDDGMKEVKTLSRFNGDETSFNEEQYDAKKQRLMDHIDYMILTCNAYIKNEKDETSDRYKRIQRRIEELEKEKTALEGITSYQQGVRELFNAEDVAVDKDVSGVSADYVIRGGLHSQDVAMTEETFEAAKKRAMDIMKELVAKCDAQIERLYKGVGTEDLIMDISSIKNKRNRQITRLSKISFGEYEEICKLRIFSNFLEVCEYDDETKSADKQAFDALCGQYKQQRQKEKYVRPDGQEVIEKSKQYEEDRSKDMALVLNVKDFEEKMSDFIRDHDEYDTAEEVLLAYDKEAHTAGSIMTKFFDNRYSDMKLGDVMFCRMVGSFCPLINSPVLRGGAEDIMMWQEYISRLLDDGEFAEKMGVLPAHEAQMDEFRGMVDEMLVISTRRTVINQLMKSNLKFNTEGFSNKKKALARQISNLYNDAFAHSNKSMMSLMEKKYSEFIHKFTEFMMKNNIKSSVPKDDGGEVDYMARVEAFENLAVKDDMSEKEAIRAKIDILKRALDKKFPDTTNMTEADKNVVKSVSGLRMGDNLTSHIMVLKRDYYEKLLASYNN